MCILPKKKKKKKLCTLNIQVLSNLQKNHLQLMHILRKKMFKIGMMHISRENV